MRKIQLKGPGENPDNAPVSSGRRATAPEIAERVDSVRAKVNRRPGKNVEAAVSAEHAGLQEIFDGLRAGIKKLQQRRKPDYDAKVQLLKEAIEALGKADIMEERGIIQLIKICMPGIDPGKLNGAAKSILRLLAENRKIDDILMAIVGACPQNTIVPDLILAGSEAAWRRDMADPDATRELGVSFAGPDPDRLVGCMRVEDDLDLAGLEKDEE